MRAGKLNKSSLALEAPDSNPRTPFFRRNSGLRIVDVCAFYSPHGGGIRSYIDAKLRCAADCGHEVIVVAPAERDEVIDVSPRAIFAGVASPTMPFDRRYRYFDSAERIQRELDRWRPDHVECSSPWSSASAVARWRGGATRSLFMHSDPMAAYAYRWFGGLSRSFVDRLFSRFWDHMRFLGRSFDVVVSPNAELAHRLRRRGLDNVATISLGVDEGFSPANRDPRLRESLLWGLGLPPSATLLLSVGRLSPEKRPGMVIHAVAEASRKSAVGLILIGDGPLHRKIEPLTNGAPIRLYPQTHDRRLLARTIASCDALVHGCEAETFGLVVAEALASGTPVIVPDRGGAFEQIKPGQGLTYSAGSKADLSRAVGEFVNSRPAVAVPRDSVSKPRLMQDHFRELFASYAALAQPSKAAA
jgi:alpha-1,6-mannosyltransferase